VVPVTKEDEQMLLSILDRHVEAERITAVDEEETVQHDPVEVSMTHSSLLEVH
jgi:hypothetical protein